MFQLALYLCQIENPNDCHWEYMASAAPSIQQCLSDFPSMAKYMNNKQKWRITKWHCNREGEHEANL